MCYSADMNRNANLQLLSKVPGTVCVSSGKTESQGVTRSALILISAVC